MKFQQQKATFLRISRTSRIRSIIPTASKLSSIIPSTYTHQSNTNKTLFSPSEKNFQKLSPHLHHKMHYQSLFLGALVAATSSTTVLAYWPYVHSFSNADCTGPDAGDKKKGELYDCVPFDSVYDAVQINFGSGYDIKGMNVYSDDNCKVFAGKTVQSPSSAEDSVVCVSQNEHGAKWRSVMQAPE